MEDEENGGDEGHQREGKVEGRRECRLQGEVRLDDRGKD